MRTRVCIGFLASALAIGSVSHAQDSAARRAKGMRIPIKGVTEVVQPVPQPRLRPNVTDTPFVRAHQILQRFDVGITSIDSTVYEGVDSTVILQHPPAGTPRLPNERDTLWIRHVVPAPPPAGVDTHTVSHGTKPRPPARPTAPTTPPSPPPTPPDQGTGRTVPWHTTVAWVIAGLIALAVLAHLTGLLGPRFRTKLERGTTELRIPPNTPVVKHAISFVTRVGEIATTVTPRGDTIIVKEERHHDPS